MHLKTLKIRYRQIVLVCALSAFAFGLGFQMGLVKRSRPLTFRLCRNEKFPEESSRVLAVVNRAALLSLGRIGRDSLKKCLCSGFKSEVCLSLEAELMDRPLGIVSGSN